MKPYIKYKLKYKVCWYNPVQKENQLVATFRHQGDAWLYCDMLYKMAKKDHKSMRLVLYCNDNIVKDWRL